MKTEIRPTYVTFEQARFLKEKGFEELSVAYYYYELGHSSELIITSLLDRNSDVVSNAYIAPEQWQVVEWLRVNHGVFITIDLKPNNMFQNIIYKGEIKFINVKSPEKSPYFNSPQEAYSAAIDYIQTNNLI